MLLLAQNAEHQMNELYVKERHTYHSQTQPAR